MKNAKISAKQVKVEVSARHCHLRRDHLEKLFGVGYELKPLKYLSQPGQFAAEEEVFLITPKGELKVRIIGPLRDHTQVEISTTECYKLGLKPVLRVSSNIEGTPGCQMRGPKATIDLKEGVIVAQRHLHLAPDEAKARKLKNGDIISIEISGPRGVIFNNVVVRSAEGHKESFMIDTDEGNACGFVEGASGIIVK